MYVIRVRAKMKAIMNGIALYPHLHYILVDEGRCHKQVNAEGRRHHSNCQVNHHYYAQVDRVYSQGAEEASIMGARMAMAGPTSINMPSIRSIALSARRKMYLFPAKYSKMKSLRAAGA